MIVNYGRSGWQIITQRAHGLLAAQIAWHWKGEDRPARWVETLLAVAEHDDAELEFEEEEVLNEAGGPLDFSMRSFNSRHCLRTSRQSRSKSRFITLLHSMHLTFLYRKIARTNAKAKEFLSEQTKVQAELRKALKLSLAEARRIYSLLECCDALSLLLCRDAIQPEHRSIEISWGPGNKDYQLRQNADHSLTVSPWPFSTGLFDVHIEFRILPRLTFTSAGDFRHQLDLAKVKEKVYRFRK